ncbi:uncharacterized protein KY384_006466 [Bacidia gigantensis]|uniref:uncharacterized protein n=1 Tax=Bacidia gigantensis TaxID=2732470 RepID=UPI001D04333D|nr:uncharacterized protein KY384_006466 [Bacidia gigantensis]KAG8528778.1 hypothetical protein KY384_006466 [Bacidia gigantensis]
MEAALKLARQYFLELDPPQPDRVHFIAREASYHGNTLGALAVSGHQGRREKYEPLLSKNTSHVSAVYEYRGRDFATETSQDYVARLVSELDEEITRVGPHKVCAFVAEPVVGAAMACTVAPSGYFAAVKSVCEKHGALLILDEVMCGIGRTGHMHAWQSPDVNVTPDLQTMGKGLGGGFIPISALLVGEKVNDALFTGTGSFTHGQTYQGHALACAGALAVQKIIKQDNLLSNVRMMGEKLFNDLGKALENHPHVGDIRGCGLFLGLEIVEDKVTKQPFPSSLTIAERISELALDFDPDFGITVYPGTGTVNGLTGDHVILAPPYNITQEDVDLIVRTTAATVDAVTKEFSCAPRHHANP